MKLVLLFLSVMLMGQLGNNKGLTPVRILNFGQLEPYLHHENDTVYLVNFWATWCGPCRKEMPAIEEVGEKYKTRKFKILLVSLDFPDQLNKGLLSFIQKNNIKSEVILLNDPHQNQWIDKVDPNWSGDLPFTLIYGPNFRETYARSFTFEELDSIIQPKLKSL